MAHGCGVHGRSWGAFCVGGEEDAHVLVCRERKTQVHIWSFVFHFKMMGETKNAMAVLTWGAASSCASGPPSSAASRVDAASAPRPRVPVYGVAGSGGP